MTNSNATLKEDPKLGFGRQTYYTYIYLWKIGSKQDPFRKLAFYYSIISSSKDNNKEDLNI